MKLYWNRSVFSWTVTRDLHTHSLCSHTNTVLSISLCSVCTLLLVTHSPPTFGWMKRKERCFSNVRVFAVLIQIVIHFVFAHVWLWNAFNFIVCNEEYACVERARVAPHVCIFAEIRQQDHGRSHCIVAVFVFFAQTKPNRRPYNWILGEADRRVQQLVISRQTTMATSARVSRIH